MKTFHAKRIAQEYAHMVPAAAAKVFPLLCPVREYDWIDGWTCNLIYSGTGVAENNCVFTTDFPRGVEETWVVSHYDPEHYVIQFVIVNAGAYVMKLDVLVAGVRRQFNKCPLENHVHGVDSGRQRIY